jgi:hypothetical protein
MNNTTNTRIEDVLFRVPCQQSALDKLVQIENDLIALHDRLAFVVDSQVGHWSASLPLSVDRATFDAMPGATNSHAPGSYPNARPYDVKHPTPAGLIALYCYEPAAVAPDHDLTAENAPDEWARSEPIYGTPVHVFHRLFERFNCPLPGSVHVAVGF